MRAVYVLHHEHEMPASYDAVKLIGVYSSQAKAEEAREQLRSQPGFKDWPDGFTIDLYEIDHDQWTKGFVTLKPEDM